jgi:hypothetical protein
MNLYGISATGHGSGQEQSVPRWDIITNDGKSLKPDCKKLDEIYAKKKLGYEEYQEHDAIQVRDRAQNHGTRASERFAHHLENIHIPRRD